MDPRYCWSASGALESGAPLTICLVAIELSDELIELERRAWQEQQHGALTVETASAVQAAVTAHAEATGQNRYEVEKELKRVVRHPEPDK